MRVLMLGSKEYPFGVSSRFDPKAGGGIELHVDRLSRSLVKRGHRVTIVTRRFPGQPAFEERGGLRIHRTRYMRSRHLRGLTYNMLAFLLSIRLARRHDIVHCHAVVAGFFGALLGRLTGRPVAFTPHGMIVDWGFPAREALWLMQRCALRGAGRIIFISGKARERLSPLTGRPHALLSNGIDLGDYSFPERSGRNPVFLFMGRLEPVKGVGLLIEAFRKVRGSCPKARLLIAGRGTLEERIRELAKGEPGVEYRGWMDSRDALKEADAFVLPSTESGQPLAILEAKAAGRIIITSLPYITPGKSGLRCEPERESLKRALLEVCKDLPGKRRLGKAAREEAREHTWEKEVLRFEREYGKALGSQSLNIAL